MPEPLMSPLAVILVEDNCSIYPSFQFLVGLPKLNVESALGIRFDVKSADIVNESVSESPMFILPPMVTSPKILESPAISNLPNDPVEVTEPLILPCILKSPLAVILPVKLESPSVTWLALIKLPVNFQLPSQEVFQFFISATFWNPFTPNID